MQANRTLMQAKQLMAATLEAPAEFWRGHAHVRQAVELPAGLNEQAYPETDEKALQVALGNLDPSALAGAPAAGLGVVPIRCLSGRHRRHIAAHIRQLSQRDRYLRFGYAATDDQVQRYVDGLDFKRDEIYGVFNRRLSLIALAHLALGRDTQGNTCAEFGVSVSRDARGKGLGTRLFERAVLHARSEEIEMLFIHALSENAAMLKIARKAGAVVENYGGEVEAHVLLAAQDFGQRVETAVKDAVQDGIGEVDFRLKLRALQFWEWLAQLQDIRQGVRAARHESAS